MSYKTILVHVDDARNADARIEIAGRLAMAEDAHLIGTATSGISRFLFETVAVGPNSPDIDPYLETLRQRADKALVRFEKLVRRLAVASFEKRLTDDEPASALSLQARYCDLIVVGQYDPEWDAPSMYADLPEYVTMNSACPVLIVPYASAFRSAGERVLIAWNASMEATRAVHHAIPLLRHAKIVEVAIFNPALQPEAHGDQPGTDIALYLARHNIKVNVMQEHTDGNVGDALLSLASNLNSDLIVMGCYGHSRFREILLGGVTRTVLQSMTVPVLMSH